MHNEFLCPFMSYAVNLLACTLLLLFQSSLGEKEAFQSFHLCLQQTVVRVFMIKNTRPMKTAFKSLWYSKYLSRGPSSSGKHEQSVSDRKKQTNKKTQQLASYYLIFFPLFNKILMTVQLKGHIICEGWQSQLQTKLYLSLIKELHCNRMIFCSA